MSGITRRALLRLTAAAAVSALLPGASLLGAGAPARAADAQAPPGDLRRRADWAPDLAPTGPLEAEAPGDTRVLLVHHSVTANDYAAEDVVDLLRAIYGFHTGDKGWADIAYNFFVDRFGRIWEGRTGSIEQPVKADATGGSQGFALSVCLLGDHREAAPSAEATDALVGLLAWLAQRYDIDPRGSTRFVSRGSNRWPAGVEVATETIVGHRAMSQTECPGDAADAVVRNSLPALVAARLADAAEPVPDVPDPDESDPAPAPSRAPTGGAGAAGDQAASSPAADAGDRPVRTHPLTGVAAAAVAASAAGVAVGGARRRRAKADAGDEA